MFCRYSHKKYEFAILISLPLFIRYKTRTTKLSIMGFRYEFFVERLLSNCLFSWFNKKHADHLICLFKNVFTKCVYKKSIRNIKITLNFLDCRFYYYCHLSNINGLISHTISPITNTFGRMMDLVLISRWQWRLHFQVTLEVSIITRLTK